MDAAPLSKKAPPAAADDEVLRSPAQQAVEPSTTGGDAAAAVAGVRTSGGEDDDEQVERFYALLDNIRAVRGMLGTGGGAATATAAAGRKRPREAEPPWRPAFRMEDFELEAEVQSDAPACCDDGNKRSRWEGSCGGARRRETTDGEEEKDGEVVEAKKGPRRAQHKARRAGVLAVDGAGSR